MRVFIFKGCVGLVFLMSGLAWALPPTFEEVVELALREHPIVKAELASLRATEALIEQAGVGRNPTFQLQSQWDGSERLSQLGLGVSKPFELGHKKAARVRVAEARHSQTGLARDQRLWQLRTRVRERFLKLLAAQDHERVQQDLLAILDRHLAISQARLSAGDLAGVEVASLQVERERQAAELAVAAAKTESAKAALSEFIPDQQVLSDGVEGELGWSHPLPELSELLSREEEFVEFRLAQAGSLAREQEVSLERANGISDLTVQAGFYMQRLVVPGSSFSPRGAVGRLDDTGPLIQLQVQIPLPLNDDNSGNIAAARARHERSLSEMEALRLELRARVRSLYQRLQGERAARARLEERARPAALKALETVEQAYKLGFKSQLELLGARDSYLKTQEALHEAAYAESLTVAELEGILGYPLTLEVKKP